MFNKSKKNTTKQEEHLFHLNPKKRVGPLAWLRSRFFTGIVVTAPIAITVGLIWGVITFIDDKVKPLIPNQWNPETYTQFALPGLGVIVVFVSVLFVGIIAANLIGRSLVGAGEGLIGRVPLVRNIYTAIKQIFETLAASQTDNFKEVVMLEYPRKGAWAVGFITASVRGDMAKKMPGMVGVFVPTTPNPTSGFLIYIRRDDLVVLDMSVEEGAKLIISAGLVVPEVGNSKANKPPVASIAGDEKLKLTEDEINTEDLGVPSEKI
ncbi:DUF502 domain-containing protein [Hirschia baltica]|uniref:DUF502 domain-containing protein n=1 Tax=Hirschia baltica (strain ATCC 49814 / DSM 5838 / IFAM 1418) TaxID=582402 RepID=C6XJH0_HIRBI|nr:DUF502 domain-containing protein [Hirschia baltica]ACT59265.1 protein of unknown function DUF502 [Hirschia baltica ATCC 49814]